jgi:hypothetical protein
VPWDTFGEANSNGSCVQNNGNYAAYVIQDGTAIKSTYGKIPFYAITTSQNGRSNPAIGSANYRCGVYELYVVAADWGFWVNGSPIEPWNEPDNGSPNPAVSPGVAAWYYAQIAQYDTGFTDIAGAFGTGYTESYSCDNSAYNTYQGCYLYHLQSDLGGSSPNNWSFHDYSDTIAGGQCQCQTAPEESAFRGWLQQKGQSLNNIWMTETANAHTCLFKNADNGSICNPPEPNDPHTRAEDAYAAYNFNTLMRNYVAHIFWYQWYPGDAVWDGALNADNYPNVSLRPSYCVIAYGESPQTAIQDTNNCPAS